MKNIAHITLPLIGREQQPKKFPFQIHNQLKELAKSKFSISLFFSDTDSKLRKVDPERYAAFLEKTKFGIIEKFNGLTQRQAIGYFKGKHGLMSENVTIFDLYSFRSTSANRIDFLMQLLYEYASSFQQECLLVLLNNKAFLVSFNT